MTPAGPPPPLKSAVAVVGLLLAGLLAWALWPQEFRFERPSPSGPERVAVYTRWGFVVKEVVLKAEGGTPLRSRTFPVGRVGLWRIGSLDRVEGGWAPSPGPHEPPS